VDCQPGGFLLGKAPVDHMNRRWIEAAGVGWRGTRSHARRLLAPWLVSIWLVTLAFPADCLAAGAVAVIVHKDSPVDSMTVDDLRRYYSDVYVVWASGEKVKIFDLPMDDPMRRVFSSMVLGKEPQDVTMEWASKRITNTAKNPPTILKSQLLMLSKVAHDVNALGYISEESVDEQKVKVVLVIK